MIKAIVFNGGLGNQMFQYAFYLRLKHKYPLSLFLFDIEQARHNHYGYELDKVFHINSKKNVLAYRILNRYWPTHKNKFHTIKQNISIEYTSKSLTAYNIATIYDGFWQSEKFFLPIESKVRNTFSFREDMLNDKTRALRSFLESQNSVSIHIRRGDYLQYANDYGLCTKEYYEKAKKHIIERVTSPFFVFFSDDIEWTKQNIKCENAIYITWNQGEQSWQDMYLMSHCKHNIIANSSFSWWGAWLNTNNDKIVIAPKQWFIKYDNYDILPEKWIKQ